MAKEKSKVEFSVGALGGVYNPYVMRPTITTPISKLHQAAVEDMAPFKVNTRLAPFAPKINTAEEAFAAIKKVQEISPLPTLASREEQRELEKVWGRFSKELRSNPEEMLKIAKQHPEALSLADPSIFSKEVSRAALDIAARAYELLPPQMQQDDSVIDKYVSKMLHDTDNPPKTIEVHSQLIYPRVDKLSITTLPIHEKCPLEKIFSDKHIQEAWEMLLTKKGLSTYDWFRDRNTGGVGTAQAFVALAYEMSPPERKAEIDALAVKAFEAREEEIVRLLHPIHGTDPTYERNIQEFVDKHGLDFDLKALAAKVHTEMCQDAADAIAEGKSREECDFLVSRAMSRTDPELYTKYFNPIEYWTKRGEEKAQAFLSDKRGIVPDGVKPGSYYSVNTPAAQSIFQDAFDKTVEKHNEALKQKMAFDMSDSITPKAPNQHSQQMERADPYFEDFVR